LEHGPSFTGSSKSKILLAKSIDLFAPLDRRGGIGVEVLGAWPFYWKFNI